MYEEEYRELVLDDFKNKLTAGVLPPELIAPKRASLRNHCVKIFRERYQKKDEPLLKSFYGERDNPAAYLIAMQNCSAEKFRNLNNFLKGESKDPYFISICMLAWMIDFEPRPFNKDLKAPVLSKPTESKVTSGNDNSEPIDQPVEPEMPQIQTQQGLPPDTLANEILDKPPLPPFVPSQPPVLQKLWPWMAAFLMIALGTYYFRRYSQTNSTSGDGCMVWRTEHYEPIPCTYKPEDRAVKIMRLDTAVQTHFKKIMEDDTLTANAIGKVWCVKIDGRYEYYTDSATHPLYPEKILHRLSQYIMNNNPTSGK